VRSRREKAEETFEALLADRVKDAGAAWAGVKEDLRKDERYHRSPVTPPVTLQGPVTSPVTPQVTGRGRAASPGTSMWWAAERYCSRPRIPKFPWDRMLSCFQTLAARHPARRPPVLPPVLSLIQGRQRGTEALLPPDVHANVIQPLEMLSGFQPPQRPACAKCQSEHACARCPTGAASALHAPGAGALAPGSPRGIRVCPFPSLSRSLPRSLTHSLTHALYSGRTALRCAGERAGGRGGRGGAGGPDVVLGGRGEVTHGGCPWTAPHGPAVPMPSCAHAPIGSSGPCCAGPSTLQKRPVWHGPGRARVRYGCRSTALAHGPASRGRRGRRCAGMPWAQ
jgi:hypothetical protein